MMTERLSAFRLYTAALKMIWTQKVHLLRLVSRLFIVSSVKSGRVLPRWEQKVKLNVSGKAGL